MSRSHGPHDPEQLALSSNAFLTDMVRDLDSQPITDPSGGGGSLGQSTGSAAFNLRRLWIPQEDDVLGSRSFLEIIMTYKGSARVCADKA